MYMIHLYFCENRYMQNTHLFSVPLGHISGYLALHFIHGAAAGKNVKSELIQYLLLCKNSTLNSLF